MYLTEVVLLSWRLIPRSKFIPQSSRKPGSSLPFSPSPKHKITSRESAQRHACERDGADAAEVQSRAVVVRSGGGDDYGFFVIRLYISPLRSVPATSTTTLVSILMTQPPILRLGGR